MKLIFFIASLLLFLAYLTGEEEREDDSRQEAQERGGEAYYYFNNRLSTLRPLLQEAIKEENKAREKLSQIEELNSFGAVINDKNVKKAQREVYQAIQKRLTIEQQIYTAERGKNKARGA